MARPERLARKAPCTAAAVLVAMVFCAPACTRGGPQKVEIVYEGPERFAASLEPAGDAEPIPGQTAYITCAVTVRLERKLPRGGGIRIEQGRLFNGRPLYGPDMRYALPDPQLSAGPAADRLTVATGGSPFTVELAPAGWGRHSPRVVFPEGLPAGEPVQFVFGDREGGGPGWTVPVMPLKVRLLCFVDPGGDGEYVLAEGAHPLLESRAHGADRLRLTAPSTALPGRVRVRVVPVRGGGGRTESSLPVCDFTGSVEIRAAGEERSAARVIFEPGDAYQDADVLLRAPGVYRIEGECAAAGLCGLSNPILVAGGGSASGGSEPGSADRPVPAAGLILWGSIQNHTAVGGHAAGLPDEAFDVARGVAALDFCAVTDHSSNAAFHWEELRTLPDRYDSPGSFAAFAGYEWSSEIHGHRHIILKNGAGTRAWSEEPTDDPSEGWAPGLSELAAAVGSDENAILCVHHTTWLRDAAAPDYDFGDPEALPRQLLFEVFSWHGSAEFNAPVLPVHGSAEWTRRPGSSFRDVLAAGRRFFVTADSDQHAAMPGIPLAIKRDKGMRYGYSGLTAVYARSFDRDGIFSAIESGRCYGTTGARIVVFFSVAGAGPGEETAAGGDLEAAVEVHGTAAVGAVQILRDGTWLAAGEDDLAGFDYTRTFRLANEPEQGVHSYYLRVQQKDGHQAWTSPVWVKRDAAHNSAGE